MNPGGYEWWYLDALSDDGRSSLSIIVMIGNVFSPYYYWSGRRDPLNHCAVNISLFHDRAKIWTMTERGRGALERGANDIRIGPSRLSFDGAALTLRLNETAAPFPTPVRGEVRFFPTVRTSLDYVLDASARHVWSPYAPRGLVEVALDRPRLNWRGEGYFDGNRGVEPLEAGFRDWDWCRCHLAQGAAAVLYNVTDRAGGARSLALRFSPSGEATGFAPPPRAALPDSFWRVKRATMADAGKAQVLRTLEDSPFYARSLLSTHVLGEAAQAVHESLMLDRFEQPWMKLLLPFRMPRALF